MGSVVRGEEDKGIIELACFFEEVEELANLIVEIFHHSGISRNGVVDIWSDLAGASIVFSDGVLPFGVDLTIFFMKVLGGMHGGMGDGGGEVTEEGFLGGSVFFHEGEGVGHDEVVDVGVRGELSFEAVFDDACWVVGVGDYLGFP